MATLRAERFVDGSQIESLSGLSYIVNRPVKAAGNPVFTSASGGHDHHQVYATAVDNGSGGIDLYNTVFPQAWDRARVARYTSPDGDTFTRPNLGLFTVDGNTNNSVVIDSPFKVFGHVSYHPSLATPWLSVGPYAGGGPTYQPSIWGSSDRNVFTVLKVLSASETNKEPWAIVELADGRWIVYYQSFPGGVRSVGAWRSNTTDITGAWTDLGTILLCTDSLNQYYSFAVWRDGDVLFAMRNIFNGANQNSPSASGLDDRQFKMELLTSRASDGVTWTLLDSHWIQAGGTIGSDDLTPGEWDYGCIKIGGSPVRVGNENRFYYSGSPEVHHPYPNSTAGFTVQHKIGYTALTHGRTGGVSGTGTAILRSVTSALASTRVTVNSTGAVDLELLDLSGNVITGYAQTDCDPIPADAIDHVVTWNGSPATPVSFKVKAYLTSAAVHSVDIAEAPANPLTIDAASSTWHQSGTAVTVQAPIGSRTTTTAVAYTAAGGPVRFAGTHADRFEMSADGSSWSTSLTIPAGTTTLYLGVTPQPGDVSLSAEVGVPL